MILLTLAGTLGVFLYSPFWGVAIYYLFAVLRPQYLWDWALRPYVKLEEGSWSFYVAVATILAAAGHKLHFLKSRRGGAYEASPTPPLTLAHFLVFAFALWTTVSYTFAHDQEMAQPWFIEYVKIFVMYFVAAYLVTTVRQLWILLLLASLALGYVAYEVNFTYLQTRRITIYYGGFGGLDNNGAGLMLAMGVPLCLFVWEGSRRWWRWAFAAFIPVLIHAVLMSYSRGAMVALLLASPLFVLRSRYKFYIILALLGIGMILPLMAGPEIQQRFFSIEQYEKDGSAQSRFQSWQAAWEIAWLNPITGVGLRNSGQLMRRFGADYEGRTIHNQYLQIAADSGFVGLAVYVAVLAAAWMSIRRVRRTLGYRDDLEAAEAHAVASGAECAMAVFCIGALFLSLELFELPYLMLLMGAQLTSVLNLQAQHGADTPLQVPVGASGAA